MDILLIVCDRLTRDQVKVGLQQFPEFTIVTGEGYAAVNTLRQRHYDCVFLEIDPEDHEGMRLLQHMRSFDRSTEAVVITTERHAKDMLREKSKMNITAFLQMPIRVSEFFRLVSRLRSRRQETEARR